MTFTTELAFEILRDIQFATESHMANPCTPDDMVRFWDKRTPYTIHPIWCAMTILTETTLDEELRLNGYKALLWHDILEDTTVSTLPPDTPATVVKFVQEMTFDSFSEELEKIWSKDNEIRLLKLYDKTSNLLDSVWMDDKKLAKYSEFTLKLANDTESNFGTLNIVKIAKSIALVNI